MLRLVSSTVGPVQLATAGATNTQTLEAYNAGDGSLNLTFTSSAPWVTAAAGSPRNCVTTSSAKTCLPIQFTINSSGLPQGLSSAVVTVSGDASTVDAPQTVVVTVRIGGVDLYAAPGNTRGVPFATSSYVNSRATTQDGANWLAVSVDGAGSFRFNYPYHIQLQPPAAMPAGTYNGSVALTGGSNPTDNQTIPVTMRVTSQPIAVASTATTFAPQPSSEGLTIRLAAGAPALAYPFSPVILLNNVGQGTLTAQDPVITGSWMKKDVVPGFFAIDPTGLSEGDNAGSVAFASNAANGTVTVPVHLQIVPKGNPSIYFQGVQDNMTFVPGDSVAQGDIMVVKGEQLSFAPYTPAKALPLGSHISDTVVMVNGTAAPLYYTSYGQIAFQMPVDTAVGTALVQVKRDDGSVSNQVSVNVTAIAPRLLQVIVNQDGSYNAANHPAHAGDVLTIYAIGLGATSPHVDSGAAAPASPLAQATTPPRVGFGFGPLATEVAPSFAGLTPGLAGLYQINVTVPRGLPAGAVNLKASLPGIASNVLTLYLQ